MSLAMDKPRKKGEILETTLGDLIEALSEETEPFVHDGKEANQVVAYILADLLYHSGRSPENRPVLVQRMGRKKTLVVH